MSARERILQRLRAVRPAGSEALPPRHLQPDLSDDPVQRFTAALVAASGSWERVEQRRRVPARVAAYREKHRLVGPVAIAPRLAAMDWVEVLPAEVVQLGSTDGQALLGVTEATTGIAETGTLVLGSGPETPTRLNFLPDHQIVLLPREAICRHLEDGLPVSMPRALNLITGPSRTADIEQTLQLGAHGPRRLHVLLLD